MESTKTPPSGCFFAQTGVGCGKKVYTHLGGLDETLYRLFATIRSSLSFICSRLCEQSNGITLCERD